jgi:hypothetical protein
MRERLIDRGAGNWVDRGQPPEPELSRVLAYYIGRDLSSSGTELRAHVEAIRGMVEADSTEVHLVGYLKEIERQFGITDDPARRRGCAIALWHIAKCAEVRERAHRLMEFGSRG